MEKEIFYEELCENAKKINIMLNDKQLEKFYNYMNLLLEWNEKINLTSITDKKEIITKHFIDSATVSKYIKDEAKIVDIGTGAGFPGIPLSIINDAFNITLVDSLNKRINFLNQVISKLELKKVKAIHARAEEIGKNKEYRENNDIAVSRAVAKLNVLIEYMLPLVNIEGKCICMKGSDCEEEIEQSKNAIKVLGGKIEKIEHFELPETDIKRTIVIIRKISKTPNKYPRKAGTPLKNPIV